MVSLFAMAHHQPRPRPLQTCVNCVKIVERRHSCHPPSTNKPYRWRNSGNGLALFSSRPSLWDYLIKWKLANITLCSTFRAFLVEFGGFFPREKWRIGLETIQNNIETEIKIVLSNFVSATLGQWPRHTDHVPSSFFLLIFLKARWNLMDWKELDEMLDDRLSICTFYWSGTLLGRRPSYLDNVVQHCRETRYNNV